MTNVRQMSRSFYKAAQSPVGWLLSAERLQEAAEVILRHEQQFEVPYFRAHEEATQQAVTIAYTGINQSGYAEIQSRPPNYPPAQLLYAYAIENVLKGLIVASEPALIDENRLNKALKSHDLLSLSETAGIQAFVQEEQVLRALSELSVWAGRYPVGVRRTDNFGGQNSDELLDWGSQNHLMRTFFTRTAAELRSKVGPRRHGFGGVVVFRQKGV